MASDDTSRTGCIFVTWLFVTIAAGIAIAAVGCASVTAYAFGSVCWLHTRKLKPPTANNPVQKSSKPCDHFCFSFHNRAPKVESETELGIHVVISPKG